MSNEISIIEEKDEMTLRRLFTIKFSQAINQSESSYEAKKNLHPNDEETIIKITE